MPVFLDPDKFLLNEDASPQSVVVKNCEWMPQAEGTEGFTDGKESCTEVK